MPLSLKPGTRVFSAVDSTELIVVKVPADPIELTIGGAPAVLSAAEKYGSTPNASNGGTAIGKRYTNADATVELLCTKPGPGVPAINGEVLVLKEARPLPASD
ncbi:hypothetical protein [Nocardia pseudovaccinii]|uniref:hypothetical protein n=1 Tax=Nocardia pseudovaccinii TaxID=189540 RepID=UPI0007A3E5AA|nr:hypothetical protein [Nocardia pseudovaccinii]